MKKNRTHNKSGGQTGSSKTDEAGTGLLTLEPIRDPFLGDYVRQFRRALEGLPRAEGGEHRKEAERLCELSRDILLRVQPAEECPQRQLDEIIALFRQACDLIRVPDGDQQVAEFRAGIRERAADLVAASARDAVD